MTTLEFILQKFGLSPATPSPITLTDFSRSDLANLFAELGFKRGVELGVESGYFSEKLARANPQAQIFLVDAWQRYSQYREHVSQDKLDGFYQRTQERVAPFGNCTIIRKFSMDAVRDFDDGELDFIFLDANHQFDYVMVDLIEWAKKVRRGGCLTGHDFFYPGNNDACRYGVIDAVNAYVAAHKISPLFILRGDAPKAPSWMMVKP